jgi:hypothetical protein
MHKKSNKRKESEETDKRNSSPPNVPQQHKREIKHQTDTKTPTFLMRVTFTLQSQACDN